MIILLKAAANAPFSIPAHREDWMTLPISASLPWFIAQIGDK
jgi:hypothetical protein